MRHNTNRRQTRFVATLALVVAASLASGALMPVAADAKSKVNKSALTEEQKIIHLLNRAGFGPRPGDIEIVKRLGINKYIEQQLHPERLDDRQLEARLGGFQSLKMSIAQLYEKYPAPNMVARELGLEPGAQNPQNPRTDQEGELSEQQQREMRQKIFAYYAKNGLKPPQALLQELQAQKLLRAAYSERQLQEAMVDFWFNHFNVFYAKGADRWLTTDYEMSAIRPHSMGKFKDLLLATAKSPAMLFYLDNFQSSSPDAVRPGRGRQLLRRQQIPEQLRNRKPGINENYARELMELHTLGVDGGYTQKDVQEVARAFTGWTIDQPRRSGQFIFRPWMHDRGEKAVLGQRIASGGGIEDGEKVIDILSRHPNTAKFISIKLVRRFVSDSPPQSLVDRVAGVYTKTDGDIREMLRAILTSPEFFSAQSYRAKIKSPFELAVSAIRALGAEIASAQQLAQFVAKMGQPLYLYQAPTGYPDRAEQWVNTGALLERLNFGLALSTNRLRGTTVELKRVAPDMDKASREHTMQRAIALLLNGDVSAETRAVLNKQMKEGVQVKGELGQVPRAQASEEQNESADAMIANTRSERRLENRRGRLLGLNNLPMRQPELSPAEAEVAKVFGLVLGSPEFQRR
jgi:uncharacterized protein (DUF1800 family)